VGLNREDGAKPGENIVLYLAGLGVTDNKVATGAGAPFAPLAHPVIQPEVSLNGAAVSIQFAGLAPGAVGLYQINLQIPADTPDGDWQLVVAQAGIHSNTTILPVRH
jgi:uncharacterized protein (TIGR03437 family)